MADIFDTIIDKQPTKLTGDIFDQIAPSEKPIGFIETALERPLEKLPFSPVAAQKMGEVLNATIRLTAKGEQQESLYKLAKSMPPFVGYGTMAIPTGGLGIYTTPETDQKLIEDYLTGIEEKQRRGYTLGGRVGQIVSEMPAFMVEFLATGGLYRTGTAVAKKIGAKILGKYATTTAGKAALATGGFAIGTAARAAGMPTRATEAILKRQIPQDIQISDEGEVKITGPVEKPMTALWKGLADHYIEIASEQVGEFIAPSVSKCFNKLPLIGKLTGALQQKWLRLHPGKNAVDFVRKIEGKVGFHGILTEVGEEFIGDISRAITDVEHFGAGKDANILERIVAGVKQDVENLPAMLIAFSIPGVIGKVTETIGPVTNISQTIADTANKTGGATLDMRTGEPIKSGFAVAISKEFEKILPTDKITPEQIETYRQQHVDVLIEDPRRTVGVWLDADTGKMTLDISTVVQNKTEALNMAKTNDQKAIFDLSKLETIPVEVKEILPTEKFTGRAYRAETGLAKPPGETAGDVVRFEQIELGNDYGITEEQLKELDKYSSNDIIWITKNKKDAMKYGPPEPITDVKGGRIIATDGEGGYLVLKPPTMPQVEKPPVTAPEKGVTSVTEAAEAIKQYNKAVTKWIEGGRKPEEKPVYTGPEMPVEIKEKKPRAITKRRALKLGHDIPDILGWSDAERMDFMNKTIGKTSMKDMTVPEMRTLVTALQDEARRRGLLYEPPKAPAQEFIDILQTKKVTEETPIKELTRSKTRQLVYDIKRGVYGFFTGQERIVGFLEGLDGKKDGLFYNKIWRTVKSADELANHFGGLDQQQLSTFIKENNVDADIWMGKVDKVPDTDLSLTTTQRIGVYALSLNKNGYRYLTKGMGFVDSNIESIIKSLSPQEIKVADFILNHFKEQWEPLRQAAAQAGFDLSKLKAEDWYFPIVRIDVELEQQTDFVSDLADQFASESLTPEAGMLKQRMPGAFGKLELDAFILYMHNAARVNRFMQMAPIAKRIGLVFNNREFKQTLNERTYNQGSKLLNSWMRDTVRGHSNQQTTQLGRAVNFMRKKGVAYAIGWNILSASKQILALNTSVSVDPLMYKYVPKNFLSAITPKGQNALDEFVYDRSLQMQQREPERDLRRLYNKQMLTKELKGKRLSPISMAMFKWMDRRVANLAWKSLYDVGMEKFNGDENRAIEFADYNANKTQAMVSEKDLPQFFRSGVLEKLLTTFQTELNTLGNYWAHDIVGAKRRGEINWTMVSYRVLQSYILPSIIYGIIGRGRLPKGKDILVDLATYGVAPLLLIGRWITAMIEGFGGSATIAETGPTAGVSLVSAIKKGNKRAIIKGAASTIGAFTGMIPIQAIRTTEGIYDLATGETTDYRRLIYSKWALQQGLPKETAFKKRQKRFKY